MVRNLHHPRGICPASFYPICFSPTPRARFVATVKLQKSVPIDRLRELSAAQERCTSNGQCRLVAGKDELSRTLAVPVPTRPPGLMPYGHELPFPMAKPSKARLPLVTNEELSALAQSLKAYTVHCSESLRRCAWIEVNFRRNVKDKAWLYCSNVGNHLTTLWRTDQFVY